MAADAVIEFLVDYNTKKANKNLNSLSGTLKKIATGAAAAFVTKGLVDFGKEAINVASDLEEVQNVVDVTFGDGAKKIEQIFKDCYGSVWID